MADTQYVRSLTEVYLQRFLIAQMAEVSPKLILDSPKLAILEDVVSRTVKIGIKGYLWGKTIEEYELEYPLDWWQAVRKRWLPAWWLRRWPVRQETRTIHLVAYWPDLAVAVPKHKPRLVLSVNGESFGGYSG